MAPVCGQLYNALRSSVVVAHAFAELSRGGSKSKRRPFEAFIAFEGASDKNTAILVAEQKSRMLDSDS